MNKFLQAFLIFIGIGLIFLGLIFIIASGIENIAIGAVMVLIAVGIFGFIYRSMKIEASKPTLVSQTWNVQMGGSGEMKKRELKCKSCGAPVEDKDLKVVDGGVMYTCSYCGTISALEEEPKW